MAIAKQDDTVKINYVGRLEDNAVFDADYESEPFEFTIGKEMVIPGFENEVIGMQEGDKKVITIPPEEAFGPIKKDLIVVVKKSQIPSNIQPKVGMKLEAALEGDTKVEVLIKDVSENEVTLDSNHPLAGKQVTFEITLLQIL